MHKANCVVCCKEFERERVSKTTCSGACRKKLSRRNIAASNAVSDRVKSVKVTMDRMLKMRDLSDFGDISYEVMVAFKELREYANSFLDDTSLVWHCSECGKIYKHTDKVNLPILPGLDDCYCEVSQWVLQRKMI